MNEWKQLLLYLYLCILEGKKLELTFSNFLTNKKLELDFANFFNHGNLTRLSSNLSFCTSVSYKPRLILLPRQGLTYTDLLLFLLFFLTSSKATMAVAVSSSLSIFKWNLLDLFEHLYRFHWILKKKGII